MCGGASFSEKARAHHAPPTPLVRTAWASMTTVPNLWLAAHAIPGLVWLLREQYPSPAQSTSSPPHLRLPTRALRAVPATRGQPTPTPDREQAAREIAGIGGRVGRAGLSTKISLHALREYAACQQAGHLTLCGSCDRAIGHAAPAAEKPTYVMGLRQRDAEDLLARSSFAKAHGRISRIGVLR